MEQVPIRDYCCGSYCSEAGCCPHQTELFTDAKRQYSGNQPPTISDFTRKPTGKPRYERSTVPDWVKENRNRDTPSNLE